MKFERGKNVKDALGIGIGEEAMCHGSSILHLKTKYGSKRISIGSENIEEFLELWKEAPYSDEPRNKELSKRIRKTYKYRNPFVMPEIEKIVITGWVGEDHKDFKSVVLFPGLGLEGECAVLKYGKEYYSVPGREFINTYELAKPIDRQVKNMSQMMDAWTQLADSLGEMQQVMETYSKFINEI